MTESLGATRALSHTLVLILLDLSFVFDPVKHQILLSTLVEHGIADSALTWFTSQLTNCTSLAIWNGSLCKPCFLETGVPQGWVLGPLLFSLYTRIRGSAITLHGCSYHLCPDNTQQFLSFPPSSNTHMTFCISECLVGISAWTAFEWIFFQRRNFFYDIIYI